jgi:hypothetical protein
MIIIKNKIKDKILKIILKIKKKNLILSYKWFKKDLEILKLLKTIIIFWLYFYLFS